MASINLMKSTGDWLTKNNFVFSHIEPPFRVFVRDEDNANVGICITYNKMFTRIGDRESKEGDLRDFNVEISKFELKK